MNISQVAKAVGLSQKSVRHYESQGLLGDVPRLENGYRNFTELTVERLRFIARARAAGFSLLECRELLDLKDKPDRHSADVKRLAQHKLTELDQQLAQLQAKRAMLAELTQQCAGDGGADCAILNSLADRS